MSSTTIKRIRTTTSSNNLTSASATTTTNKLIAIRLPSDLHHHFRDDVEHGDGRLELVAPIVSKQFGRVLAMPNLVPPITTVDMALQYRERILKYIPEQDLKHGFDVVTTLYLTEHTRPQEIELLQKTQGKVVAVKLYPAGATTNSSHGVRNLDTVHGVLQKMQDLGIPLLIHGEVVDADVDPFDREHVFIERKLKPLIQQFPLLKIVLEHCTTKDAVDFVLSAGPNIAGTITPQHLLYDRSALFQGGLRPHMYCLPILKRGNPHRLALLEALKSPKFFLGTDSAPHAMEEKLKDCGCAGCFSGLTALELYLEAFEEANALEHFEAFASLNGPKFYGNVNPFPSHCDELRIVLEKNSHPVPEKLPFTKTGSNTSFIIPLRAGLTTQWKCIGIMKESELEFA
jgi:dihydroorotase